MKWPLLALALPASALTSLGPAQGDLGALEDRHDVVHHDVDQDGTHWARGRDYKSSADASGFSFIPFLGSDARQNYPVRFRLLETSRGSTSLPLDEGARVTRTQDRIVLDRGTVQIRYDFTPDSVEQSFAFTPPEGEGDLTLTLGVETDLTIAADEGGFRFSNARGGVRYGAATAFDATGRSVAVPATLSGGTIRLSVPASFLTDADGPIVVDPLVSAFALGSPAAELTAPDAAYDEVRFCVVAQEQFSGNDMDTYSWFLTAGGTASGGAYVEQSNRSWAGPRIAYEGSGRTFRMVAEAGSLAVPGSSDLVTRTRYQDGTFNAPSVLKSATLDYSCVAPDIGGDNIYKGFSFCVAYNRDYGTHRDVHALHWGGSPFVDDHPIATSVSHDESAPAISKQVGIYPGSKWVIAWASRDLTTTESSVHACHFWYDGSQIEGPFVVAPPTTNGLYFDVDVSIRAYIGSTPASERYFLVTYDDRPSDVTDAFVALCAGQLVLDTIELQVIEHADRGPNQDNVQIATGLRHFFLGYVENGTLHVTTVQPVDGKLGIVERRQIAVGSDVAAHSLAAAERVQTGTFGFQSRGLFLWSQPGASSSVVQGTFATLPPLEESGGWQYCYGAPNSTGDRGFIMVLGNRRPGHAHTIRVEALPPGVFGYFLASMTTGFVPNVGGSQGTLCVGGSVGRFGIYQSDASGTTTHSLDTLQMAQPTGNVSATAGQVWAFQSWHRDAVGGMATSNFTNAATISFE